MKPLIVDAHQDLAYNMLTFGRDYTQPVEETRSREAGGLAVEHNGDCTLSWQEYQRGRVALIFSTLFAAPIRGKERTGWETQVYADMEQAHRLYNLQIDTYNRLFDKHPDKFTPIHTRGQLEATLAKWEQADQPAPTGLITLMEGAEGVRSVGELEEWWQRGVRLIGPAWKSTRFCGGTREPGPLTAEGRELLQGMAPIGFTLDISHMAWESAVEALDLYEGAIVASHANALKQVRNGSINRFLTDEIIEGIIKRDGVIGVVPFNSFLIEGWTKSDPRSDVPLDMVAAQMDYICQKAGDASHVGLGTDFDGGFGLQSIPDGLDTVADIQQLGPLLEARGYSQADIAGIMGGNWIRTLRRTLP
ncbi:MAG TPA: membrane dipeptidase [Anaerolineales bacterium]|jgi:membrane dipeptidase